MDITQLLGRVAAAIRPHFADFTLRPPASAGEIAAFEAQVGIPLPEDLRRAYLLHDGEADTKDPAGSIGLLAGYEFLSVEQARQEYEQWTGVLRDAQVHPDVAAGPFRSSPPGAVDEVYWRPGWVPFAGRYSGNHLGVDLNPGPQGVSGQVITFGADDRVHFVVARSFGEFLAWLAERYEAGRGHFKLQPGGPQLYDEMRVERNVEG